jgi:hypothetical protein
MARDSDARLAEAMLHWHRRHIDPVRRLADQLRSGGRATVHADTVELALDAIRQTLHSARMPRCGYSPKEVAELEYIARRLDTMLCTMPYGELPHYEDFRRCLEAHGVVERKRSATSIEFEVQGRSAEIAEEAVELTESPRKLFVTKLADRKGVRVTIRNAKTLYKYLRAVSRIQGPTAKRLGTDLAKSIGFTWV